MMGLINSTMLPLGTIAPDFNLLDVVANKQRPLASLKSSTGTLIFFICNHCPYVKHVLPELVQMAHDYQQRGIAFIGISANDIDQQPDDSPTKMKELMQKLKFPFIYLYDETQMVAKAYEAACTPDFFLFDHQMRCVYRGQLDDSRPGNQVPLTGQDLRMALDNLLTHQPIDPVQKPSIGCSIKWKA